MPMSSDDLIYYRGRADAERALAGDSNRKDVAAIHAELATLYDALIAHEELRIDGQPVAARSAGH